MMLFYPTVLPDYGMVVVSSVHYQVFTGRQVLTITSTTCGAYAVQRNPLSAHLQGNPFHDHWIAGGDGVPKLKPS